ncbi:MAG TPA: hypothetical protein VMF06_21965 [Candidatus Limnocylindria bacterium]|jgi:hypothetical protein|nr:hypothetical protein [Candidatus Limnocylindria bacterium]
MKRGAWTTCLKCDRRSHGSHSNSIKLLDIPTPASTPAAVAEPDEEPLAQTDEEAEERPESPAINPVPAAVATPTSAKPPSAAEIQETLRRRRAFLFASCGFLIAALIIGLVTLMVIMAEK